MRIGKSLSGLRALLAWNKASYTLMSLFAINIVLILYIWQPLVKEYLALFNPAYPVWMQIDWLLVGIFAFMSLMIMAGADLRRDAPGSLRGTDRRVGDRELGHADATVDLLHSRAPAVVDHPRLADRQPGDRPHAAHGRPPASV